MSKRHPYYPIIDTCAGRFTHAFGQNATCENELTPVHEGMKISLLLLISALAANASAQRIATTQSSYATGTPIQINWEGAKSANDWIGIYAQGSIPARGNPSPSWAYTNQTRTAPSQVTAKGSMALSDSLAAGNYVVHLLADDSYTILGTASFIVSDGKTSSSISTSDIKVGQPLSVSFSGAGIASTSWIAVYPKGKFNADYTRCIPLDSRPSGSVRFTELPAGEYELYLFPGSGYQYAAKTRVNISP